MLESVFFFSLQTFAIKKKALERQRQIENGEIDGRNEPELVIPAMAKLETKAYKPGKSVQFSIHLYLEKVCVIFLKKIYTVLPRSIAPHFISKILICPDFPH